MGQNKSGRVVSLCGNACSLSLCGERDEALGLFNIFFEVVIQMLIDGGWRTTDKTHNFQQRNNEKNQHSFQERKGNESGAVGNGNKLHEKSVHGKEMTEMSFTCQ